MSSLQTRAGNVLDARLAALANTTANLKTQMQELDGLRDRIRKARLSNRRSRFPVVQRQGHERRDQWSGGIESLCGSDKRPVTHAQKPLASHLPEMSEADEVHAGQKRRSRI